MQKDWDLIIKKFTEVFLGFSEQWIYLLQKYIFKL